MAFVPSLKLLAAPSSIDDLYREYRAALLADEDVFLFSNSDSHVFLMYPHPSTNQLFSKTLIGGDITKQRIFKEVVDSYRSLLRFDLPSAIQNLRVTDIGYKYLERKIILSVSTIKV